MKSLKSFLLLWAVSLFLGVSQTTLLPIKENHLWGYINTSGEVVISPKFQVVSQFSEGLAAVRLNGTYGYIDQTGEFVIEPQYDVAYSFMSGRAIVFINGVPFLIDKSGKIQFQHNYQKIIQVTDYDIFLVFTHSQKYGIINALGELILDTAFSEIGPFSEGLAVVEGLHHRPYGNNKRGYEIGVINPQGEFVIPFREFSDISTFQDGYASVRLRRKKDYITGVIDKAGNGICFEPEKGWEFEYEEEPFSEGVAIVTLMPSEADTMKSWLEKEKISAKGVVNLKGELLFSNDQWKQMSSFQEGRSFVQTKERKWFLIDKKGEVLNEKPYKSLMHERFYRSSPSLFQDGLAIVKLEGEDWCVIDTNGNVVVPSIDYNIGYSSKARRGDWLIFSKDMDEDEDSYNYLSGYWNLKNGSWEKPFYQELQPVNDEMVFYVKDDKMGYFNESGEVIWEERQGKKELKSFNIDFMNRGYFYAFSTREGKYANIGGWGVSSNTFRTVKESLKFPPQQLSLIVKDQEIVPFYNEYQGMKLYVANMAEDTMVFDAQDSRLYMKIQAQDQEGNWKDIEYLPSSWCGNSYHYLYLPKDHYWEFTIPVYEGEYTTRLRAELRYKTGIEEDSRIIYSNEFEGSVNPGQFWRKSGYSPSGIMDPYND